MDCKSNIHVVHCLLAYLSSCCKSIDVAQCYQQPSHVELRSMPGREQFPDTGISLDNNVVRGGISDLRMSETLLVPARLHVWFNKRGHVRR
jgi:hypothetical protein